MADRKSEREWWRKTGRRGEAPKLHLKLGLSPLESSRLLARWRSWEALELSYGSSIDVRVSLLQPGDNCQSAGGVDPRRPHLCPLPSPHPGLKCSPAPHPLVASVKHDLSDAALPPHQLGRAGLRA